MTIRPQYHFRPGPDGLQAWDVRKLIAATSDLPVTDVPLSEIAELDEPYWYAYEETPTVRAVADHAALIAAADLQYPIILCAQGRLMDGMHRVAKAYLAGLAALPAVRFETTPLPDHVGVAPDDLSYD